MDLCEESWRDQGWFYLEEEMGNITRETKILRKNQKEILEIKNNLTQMKKVFYGLTSRVDAI